MNKTKKLSIGKKITFWVGLVVSFIAIYEFIIEDIIVPPPPKMIETEELKMVESELIPDYSENPIKKHETLIDFIKESNTDICDRLLSIKDSIISNPNYRSIDYYVAPAGYGKSYFIPELIEIYLGKINIFKLELSEIVKSKKVQINCIPDLEVYDLSNGKKQIINKLPSFELTVEQFVQFIDTNKRVIIIDGIDEVHQETANSFLKVVDDWVSKQEKGYSVFKLGRPEAFYPFLNGTYFSQPENIDYRIFEKSMAPPCYSTYLDLQVRVEDYLKWYLKKYYNEQPTKKDIERVYNKLVEVLKKYPYLKYSMRTASNSGFIISKIYKNKLVIDNEQKLKETLFTNIMQRNSDSHNRPMLGSPEGFLYQRMLELIAIKYINDIDSTGWFEVGNSPIILVNDKIKYEFDVKKTLERSGIVDIEPISNRSSNKFRFEPFWLHRYLIEEYNKRIKQKATAL